MNKKNNELVFAPLGGVGEIGMNFGLYGIGPKSSRKWMIVDCGVTFPGPELPGVDLVLPDISFIEEQRDNLLGMVITHAHEDHYGAILDLWPRLECPVHMSAFTAAMLESKREPHQRHQIDIRLFKANETFAVGPFSIKAISVTHSIPEPFSLLIETEFGRVLHTGDWKFDPEPALGQPVDEDQLSKIGDEGLLALVCDSTNAMTDGESPSEKAVNESLTEQITKAPGRVVITTFSSNVGRIRSVMEAARDSGRSLLVLGRSMRRVMDVAGDLGYLDGLPEPVSEDEADSIPRENLAVICTGSQGESRAALAKLARDEMRSLSLTKGDMVIFSSRAIPGNEKAINDIKNGLVEMGVRILENDEALVHVSGHPRRNELRRMYGLTRPTIAVPVHGEAAHLAAHAALAAGEGIAQVASIRNGDLLKIAPGNAEIVDKIEAGRHYKDGLLYGDDRQIGLRDRRKLAFAGIVCLNVIMDEKLNLLDDPDIEAVGLPFTDGGGEGLEDILLEAAIGAIESIPTKRRRDLDLVAEAARRAIRAEARDVWGKKPQVTVFVSQV
ncbi:MBL fold metallo-hydrolase [Notoacmeibacter marinus]|uniref:MBL fold metallo-hydrolase n=1 Tax=Notoacmeibacter marinus TaxID=1876515 RepID=A0A231UTT0_9HYPH|nr:ribonuclease J [Notoacmeibacter marinus]OXS99271.1 MBL fold metallo-hydrolase [Notoacmeibacter marinus]